jgi:hypothetical protein
LIVQHYYRELRLRPGPVTNVSVYQPIKSLRDLKRADVPVILGSNAHEGTVFVFTAYPTIMVSMLDDMSQYSITSLIITNNPAEVSIPSCCIKFFSR